MSTARMTLGSAFTAVGTSFNAVTSVIGTAVVGISMLDAYAKSCAEQQQARIAVDNADFEDRLAEEKAQEMAERQLQVLDFINKSKDHAKLYQNNYDRIQKVLAERKAA